MSENLTRETLAAIEKVMPQALNPNEMIALICTMVAAYEMQVEWEGIAEEVGLRLSEIARRGAKVN